MELENKIIIVTGGSGLLGKAFINQIKKEGGHAINFDVSCSDKVEYGEKECDITDRESVREAIHSVVEKYGRIDGLVNNAYPRTKDWGTDFRSQNMESWEKNFNYQLHSHVYITKEVCREMEKSKAGFIVNIASIYGVVGNDPIIYEGTSISIPAAYSAIKGATINFTRFLASYYGKSGIKVNCISPGGIFDNQDSTFVKNYEKKVPLGRMGKPSDIAPVVSFLLSDKAGYITGQNIIVDGGYTIR